jgi:hypothetical protein
MIGSGASTGAEFIDVNSSISIKTIVRRTIAAYAAQARLLLPVAAISFLILAGLSSRPARSSPMLVIGAFILSILVFALFTGMVVTLTANAWEGRPALTARSLVSTARPALGELILVGFVALIAISFLYSLALLLLIMLAFGTVSGAGVNPGGLAIAAVGFALMLAPGTYLLTAWAVAAPVVVLERPGGLRALTRSGDLVRGRRWKVLVLAVPFWIVASAGGRALVLTGGTAPGVAVRLIVVALLAPIPLLGVTALYFELRKGVTTEPPRTDTRPHAPLGGVTPPGARPPSTA